jgi:hypothetical protein
MDPKPRLVRTGDIRLSTEPAAGNPAWMAARALTDEPSGAVFVRLTRCVGCV